MARQFAFLDGFDCYTDLTLRWDNNWGYYASGSWNWGLCTISLTGGRQSSGRLITNGFSFAHTNSGGVERWRNFTNESVWVFGVALKATMETGNGSVCWFKADGIGQLYLKFCSSGRIEVWVMYWNSTTGAWVDEMLAQSDPGLFLNSKWLYYEMKCTAHASAGTIEVRLNGNSSPIISETGVRTIATEVGTGAQPYPGGLSKAYYNSLVLGNDKWTAMSGLGVGAQEYDDCFVDVGADAAFRGDSHVFSFLPIGNGNYHEWLASAGTNFQCVDEPDPNITDYVSEGTPNIRDTYTHNPLPTMPDGATIHTVAVSPCAMKQSPGVAELAPMVRSAGTDSVGVTVIPLAADYLYYTSFWDQDPATTSGWSVSGVNDLEFGQKVIT